MSFQPLLSFSIYAVTCFLSHSLSPSHLLPPRGLPFHSSSCRSKSPALLLFFLSQLHCESATHASVSGLWALAFQRALVSSCESVADNVWEFGKVTVGAELFLSSCSRVMLGEERKIGGTGDKRFCGGGTDGRDGHLQRNVVVPTGDWEQQAEELARPSQPQLWCGVWPLKHSLAPWKAYSLVVHLYSYLWFFDFAAFLVHFVFVFFFFKSLFYLTAQSLKYIYFYFIFQTPLIDSHIPHRPSKTITQVTGHRCAVETGCQINGISWPRAFLNVLSMRDLMHAIYCIALHK